jgi:hypothetical protein
MAEVVMGTLYKVSITEYDCGVQRVDAGETKFFTTFEETCAYKAQWEEGGSYECFWRGEITRV